MYLLFRQKNCISATLTHVKLKNFAMIKVDWYPPPSKVKFPSGNFVILNPGGY